MTTYVASLTRVDLTNPRDEPPGLFLKLSWPNPPRAKILVGFDSPLPMVEHLDRVAAALSAAAKVDNFWLIGRQPVKLEVDRKRYVTAITFLKTNLRVDLRYLFRGCVQADDGTDVPSC